MTDAIRHRGPDDAGHWCDGASGIALGHRRLSILDLSLHGHQPMQSRHGRFVMSFNGEIYNFVDLRARLERDGARFHGHSDTEVMLAAFEAWGLVPALQSMAGMFAFALWDREQDRLHLVRDRLGEKPLYFGWAGDALLFGSELKALRQHPAWKPEIDRGALSLYLRHNYVPAPFTIFRNIFKVRPGSVLTFRATDIGVAPKEESYWSARHAAEQGRWNPLIGSDAELIAECERQLLRTVGQEMVADVPLGAFLSGGIDSSLIVALMQAQSDARVKTFTIGFHEKEYDEAPHARMVAQHLGTDHTELYVTPQDTLDVIPRLPSMYDEPFADASQVPTFLVAQLARASVSVSLSGDGGDELFGGYNRYSWGRRIWTSLRPAPRSVRRGTAHALRSLSPERWDRAFDLAARVLPARYRLQMPGDRVHKLASVLDAENPQALYRRLISNWQEPLEVVVEGSEPVWSLTDRSALLDTPHFVEQMMYLDTISYLPDDILVKVDRASMAVSLESRAPFLDHRVMEFAWRLPLSAKVREGRGKWILRRVLDRYVPRTIIDRPKMGFSVPIDRWLRGPLKDWAAALLAPERLRREGFFNPEIVGQKWLEHQSGARNWQYPLWAILVFQAWLEVQVAPVASPECTRTC